MGSSVRAALDTLPIRISNLFQDKIWLTADAVLEPCPVDNFRAEVPFGKLAGRR
jgi:hypothetical protein